MAFAKTQKGLFCRHCISFASTESSSPLPLNPCPQQPLLLTALSFWSPSTAEGPTHTPGQLGLSAAQTADSLSRKGRADEQGKGGAATRTSYLNGSEGGRSDTMPPPAMPPPPLRAAAELAAKNCCRMPIVSLNMLFTSAHKGGRAGPRRQHTRQQPVGNHHQAAAAAASGLARLSALPPSWAGRSASTPCTARPAPGHGTERKQRHQVRQRLLDGPQQTIFAERAQHREAPPGRACLESVRRLRREGQARVGGHLAQHLGGLQAVPRTPAERGHRRLTTMRRNSLRMPCPACRHTPAHVDFPGDDAKRIHVCTAGRRGKRASAAASQVWHTHGKQRTHGKPQTARGPTCGLGEDAFGDELGGPAARRGT